MSENQLKWLEDLNESMNDTPEEHLPGYKKWLSYALHLNSPGNNKRSAAKWKIVSKFEFSSRYYKISIIG